MESNCDTSWKAYTCWKGDLCLESAGDIESLLYDRQEVRSMTLPANKEVVLENIKRSLGLNINGSELSYDILKSAFLSAQSNENRYTNMTHYSINEILKLEVIVERMRIDVFVNDCELYYINEFNSL